MNKKTLDKLLNLGLLYLSDAGTVGARMYCRNGEWIAYYHINGDVDICASASVDRNFHHRVSEKEASLKLDINRIMKI